MVDWGGALKDTRTRLQGWTGVFFPTPGCWVLMSGVDGGDLWLQLSACTIAKAMRHDLQSSKSPGRATAQPGTAWVLWELREVGGVVTSQGSRPRKTVCPHGTWGSLWFVLRQMRGDTQQTFRKGFETSLMVESRLTNAYSFNWQKHGAPTGC